MGLFGQIFCDFGNEFFVTDTDGEPIKESLLYSITNDNDKVIVTTVENKPHDLTTGSFVKFTELKGDWGEQLNEKQFEIKYINKFSFEIKYNVTHIDTYTDGGNVIQVKVPNVVNFKSLEDSRKNPEFVMTNFLDFDRPNLLHACYMTFNDFVLKNKKYPSIDNFSDFYKEVQTYHKDCDKIIVNKFLSGVKGNLTPINAIIGGTVAQEVIKACSGKFNPIYQWLYFDNFECLPDNFDVDKSSGKNRYSGQIEVFGEEFQNKINNLKYFVVGAGAIGCEILKNFAMIGLGSDGGKIVVTDMDTIERSNLNRQFLFRTKNIGHSKSTAAAEAIKHMNPQINVEAHENRVGPENENIYGPDFYKQFDGIANALDNLQARLYMDMQCVNYQLPLLESGTLGTKGNTQVIIPHVTESYGSSSDPPEDSIPFCTVRNFPNSINHTIEWARMQFEELFENGPQNAVKYLVDPNYVNNLTPSDLVAHAETIKKVLDNVPNNFEDCVSWAFNLFLKNYRDNIMQLLHKFPEDCLTKEGGKFWSGAKKCPIPITFDENNESHIEYIKACANLKADLYGISHCIDNDTIKNIANKLEPYEFIPDSNTHISENDEEEKKKKKEVKEELDHMSVDNILKNLPNPDKFNNIVITPLEFEKDDDTNFHIDFITTSSNMRASNYNIKTASKHQTKGIAGKIIPAIATTTSIVAGMVTIELYKLVQKFDDLERYHNNFINLALPYFGFSEPIRTPVIKYKEAEFTMWDTFEIKYSMTLKQMLEYFETQYAFELEYINFGNLMIYSFFMPPKKINERMGMKIEDIIEKIQDKKIDQNMIVLATGVEPEDDNDDDDIDIPSIKYYFK
jgi:ubiquitin-activating enzyme E1